MVCYRIIMRYCNNCEVELTKRHQKSFCSNKCQGDFKYRNYIKKWKQGNVDGSRGIVARNISGHLKRYMLEKFGEKCSLCGWDERHPNTGRVPIEIDHVDGNAENNLEKNLRLLCPNCHSLTSSFKNLNKGHGRRWRMVKYIREQS